MKDKKQHPLQTLVLFVDRQAEDPGLWFQAETATEAYLQHALRALHCEIENLLPLSIFGGEEPYKEDDAER